MHTFRTLLDYFSVICGMKWHPQDARNVGKKFSVMNKLYIILLIISPIDIFQ